MYYEFSSLFKLYDSQVTLYGQLIFTFMKTTYLLIIILILETVTCLASQESNELYLVRIKGKYGYINKTGTVVIEPQFDLAKDFSEGLAAVVVNGEWGYIDESGRVIIKTQYSQALPFFEGLAQVRTGGEWTAEPVYLLGGKTSYIDKTGKEIFTLSNSPTGRSYDEYGFSEGLSALHLGGGKYGYVDKTGKLVVEPKFDMALYFSEGLASVWVGNYIRFINKTGNFAFKQKFPVAGWGIPNSFSEGLVAVPIGGKKMGFIDKSGKTIIQPKYYRAENFSEGLAVVQSRKDKDLDGYIDKTGKIVIRPQFEIARKFNEGLAAVRMTGKWNYKWGFINKTGKLVIEPQFDEVTKFSNGISKVTVNWKIGYIDKTGKYIWQPT